MSPANAVSLARRPGRPSRSTRALSTRALSRSGCASSRDHAGGPGSGNSAVFGTSGGCARGSISGARHTSARRGNATCCHPTRGRGPGWSSACWRCSG